MRVVIVGAGLSGLAAARVLAQDHDVLVLRVHADVSEFHGTDSSVCGHREPFGDCVLYDGRTLDGFNLDRLGRGA